MKVIALRTFQDRELGKVVRRGQTYTVSDKRGHKLIQHGLAKSADGHVELERAVVVPEKAREPKREKAVVPSAPEPETPPSLAGGAEQPSSASPPARRSRRTTARRSTTGEGAETTDA